MTEGPPSADRPLLAAEREPVPGSGFVPGGGRVGALDGLRAFALLGMLLWHAEVGWVQGGFVRMTIFFALSGYLATRSWQRIQARGDRMRTFWWRRARRLLPVSFLGVGFAIAVTVADGTASMRERLGGDVLSVLAYVSNLRFWLSGQGYGELFGEPSLLQHYWTLSIEEQSFALLPLLVVAAMALSGRRPRVAAGLVTALAAACVALPLVVPHSPDAVWYSSIVRFGEFCGGVALALWWSGRSPAVARRPTGLVGLAGLGTASLVAIVATMLLVPREADWLYRGGMGLFLLPTVGLLAATAVGAGPAARLLGFRPLAVLGRWTFSIYVLHWPLFWVVDGTRTGLGGWELATVRLTVAVLAGAVVHALVERPLMDAARREPVTGRRSIPSRLVPAGWWRTGPAAAGLGGTALALAVVGLVVTGPGSPYRFEQIEPERRPLDPAERVDPGIISAAEMRMVDASEGRIAVGLFGGSTALVLDVEGADWFDRNDDLALRPGAARLGCGLVTEGTRLLEGQGPDADLQGHRPPEECGLWPETWPRVTEIAELDVALVLLGVWDTVDVDLDEVGPTHVGQPDLDAVLREHLTHMVRGFLDAGVRQVQLATTPVVGPGESGRVWPQRGLDETHPERVAAFNDLLAEVADDKDEVVLVDYGGALDSWDRQRHARKVPDGVHPTPEAVERVWEEHLGPKVIEAFDGS